LLDQCSTPRDPPQSAKDYTSIWCLICALQNRVTKASAHGSLPAEIHRLVRPVFFAGVFTGFFAAFLVAIFLFGDFFAAAFFAAFFRGAFLGALLTGAFFANGSDAFLAGVSASVTEATAPPTAVLTEPATSSAIARPYPTFPAAFSNIVFSAIFSSLHDGRLPLRIVEVYPRNRADLSHSFQFVGFRVTGQGIRALASPYRLALANKP
jgi:hypothetical protein